jgi:hypothetical protein
LSKRRKSGGKAAAVERPLDPGIADPSHGTRTRRSDRAEFDASEDSLREGMSSEAAAINFEETMASTGDSDSSFQQVASGTATGLGVDRGIATGVGGLSEGEDLDPVAEGDYWRESFRETPYYEAGAPYEDYEPGYRFGWETAADPANSGLSFEELEPELERKWKARTLTERDAVRGKDALTWNQLRQAAREAWNRVRRGREEQSL